MNAGARIPLNLNKAFTMALFGQRWESYLKLADPALKSLERMTDQDFLVDIAIDSNVAKAAIIKKFEEHAGRILDEGRLLFTDLPEGCDNKYAAYVRLNKYMNKQSSPVRILFAADLDDIFPPDYNRKMTQTIEAGAPVAIANQISFPLGSDWRQGKSIQVPDFPRGYIFDLEQILDFNIAGFCNTAIDLKSDVFQKKSSQILFALCNGTNKQLDRAFYAAAFAYGAYGVLSDANMGYGQGNGFYGQNGTSLESELNMQVQMTDLLMNIDGLLLKESQLIQERSAIDRHLKQIMHSGGAACATYRMIVEEDKAARLFKGKSEQWGQQVSRRTKEHIEATIPRYLITQMQLL